MTIAMYFIGLVKFTKKQTKDVVAANLKRIEQETKEGIKVHGIYRPVSSGYKT
ncbi:MAG: hypothetical protein LUQ37_06410 [Methanoregulaceae archaeon]|nr:hypothetical protein [Methanoregulaceae archaeon]